jgi:branched-chain amino acid transport system permease protein
MLLANRRLRNVLPIAVALVSLGIAWALSVGLSGYTVYLAISMVTATISILGLGVVTGSAHGW